MPRENTFQPKVINKLHELFPGCEVWKNDTSYRQGIPDLLILHRKKWAVLECKRSIDEEYEPNQEYYLERLGKMSFAAMICPENEEAVLGELQSALAPGRATRVSKRVKVPLGQLY